MGAAIFAITRHKSHHRVPQEALICITYVVAAAAGNEELRRTLIGGVLLVFSYLIVPAVCANYLAMRVSALLAIGWITATLSSVIGLYAAYRMDLPTGAAIVCVLGAALVLAAMVAKFRNKTDAEPEPEI